VPAPKKDWSARDHSASAPRRKPGPRVTSDTAEKPWAPAFAGERIGS